MANETLDFAGFLDTDSNGYREAPDNSDFSVEIQYIQTSTIAEGCCEAMADALDAVGIASEVVPVEEYLFLTLRIVSPPDMFFTESEFEDFSIEWLADEYWSENAYEKSINLPEFMNDYFDSWCRQFLHSTDYDSVYKATMKVQEIIVYESPVIVYYEKTYSSGYRTDRFEIHVDDSFEGATGWWTNYRVHLKDSEGSPYGGNLRRSLPEGINTFNVLAAESDSNQVF